MIFSNKICEDVRNAKVLREWKQSYSRANNGEQKCGIYGGRASKFLIWDKKTVGVVMDYERNWKVKPLNDVL